MTETFEMVPASSGAMAFLIGISLLLVGVLLLFGFLAYSTKHAEFQVTEDGLRLKGDLFGRFLPAGELVIEEAGQVDVGKGSPYRPSRRTMGTGLPGYYSGWFKLKNGEKALLYLTDRKRAVRVPTRAGYTLILSVAEPERFLAALDRLKRG